MKAIVLGATGLVGNQLLEIISTDPNFSKVLCPVRRNPDRLIHKMLVNKIHDNSIKNNEFSEKYRADLLKDLATFTPEETVVFCCLGTTIKKAGSKENFRKVDQELVLTYARFLKEWGVQHFWLVSAVGANSQSPVFYNRIKGETENELKSLNFKVLGILRPSLLLGKRTEFRAGEAVGKALSYFVSPFLLGSLRKYHPIEARDLANTLRVAALHFAEVKEHIPYKSDLGKIFPEMMVAKSSDKGS